MARASTYTHLSLDRYARVMGINPAHFHGANQISLSTGETLFPIDNQQNNLWCQFAWQNADQVSREELAQKIFQAEKDIKEYLGYAVAPEWETEERHDFPVYHRPEYGHMAYDVRGSPRSIRTKYAKFISGGRRATSYINMVNVVYSDPDSDGWDEEATVALVLPAALANTDINEIRCYFSTHNGEREWEIRSPKRKSKLGLLVTFVYNSWQMIDPDLYELLPTNDVSGKSIDISTTANYVVSVEVYREYNDTTDDHVEFITYDYSNGSVAIDGGYLVELEGDDNVVIPFMGTYSIVDGEWSGGGVCSPGDADYMKLYYLAGLLGAPPSYSLYDDYLPEWLATSIAYIATARLERIFYANNNATALATNLRQDIAIVSDGFALFPDNLLRCPFGTRYGEVMAYRSLRSFAERKAHGAVV
jgi:hypothetical protein